MLVVGGDVWMSGSSDRQYDHEKEIASKNIIR